MSSISRRGFLEKSGGAVATLGLARAAEARGGVRLLVRADDIGATRSVNEAIIRTFEDGIVRTTELMVPTPWFPDAVARLKTMPDELDVGLHLVMTSEWEAMRWRPLTTVPSLVGADGYFRASVWPREGQEPSEAIVGSPWKLEEVERELRAQIEIGLRHCPRISHFTTHMAFEKADPAIAELVKRLAKEVGCETSAEVEAATSFRGWEKEQEAEARVSTFIERLGKLSPGLHRMVVHPALDDAEMRALGHEGYRVVARNLGAETEVLTNDRVKGTIERLGIRLVSYKNSGG